MVDSEKSVSDVPFLSVALVLTLVRGLFHRTEFAWVTPFGAAAAFTALALFCTWRRRRSSDSSVRNDPALSSLLAGLGVLLMILFSHEIRLWGDAINHYAYTVSIAEDGDLDFENNARELAGGEPAKTYLHYSIGPSLLWLPGYAVAEGASRLTGRPPDGWNALYRNAAALSSLLFGWSGLVATYLAARRLATLAAALLAVASIGAGTFLLGYLAWAPTESHASAFGATAWLVFATLRLDPLSPRNALLLGALLGFATLQRWQVAVIGLFVAASFFKAWMSRTRPAVMAPIAAAFAGFFLLFLPQMLVWKSVFGAWLTIPQGAAFVDAGLRIEGVLFSPRHGLFSWSPVLYLALPGFLMWARREPIPAVGAVLAMLAAIRTNAGLADWSGGSAFGARRFDLTLPFFGLALALVFDRLAAWVARRPRAAVAVVAGAFVGWNFLFASAYFSGRFSNSDSVPFVDEARGVANELDARIGSPFSLPAALYRRAFQGLPLTAFEGTYLDRRFSTLSIRMGQDDRLFLDDGWSPPFETDGVRARRVIGSAAGVTLPVHSPHPSLLGLRLRSATGEAFTVELWMNDRRVDAFDAPAGWADHEAVVVAEVLREGRNSLRIVGVGEGSEGALVVAGVWFDRRP